MNDKSRRIRKNCTLTKAQDCLLRQEASKHGYTPTEYLREAAFAYIGQTYLVPRDTQNKLASLTFLTRNIASNLNQIAQHTNTIKSASVFDLLKARAAVLQLEKATREFIENPLCANQIDEPENADVRASPRIHQPGSLPASSSDLA